MASITGHGRLRRLVRRALHPATPLAAAALLAAAYAGGRYLESQERPYVSLYGEVVDGNTLRGKSCHDLAYPEVRCFDTPEEMFDDQIRNWPSRAAILQEPDKPAFIVYRGERRPLSQLGAFVACNALGFPEIRCFDSERESLLDQVTNFPDQARTARHRLSELDGQSP